MDAKNSKLPRHLMRNISAHTFLLMDCVRRIDGFRGTYLDRRDTAVDARTFRDLYLRRSVKTLFAILIIAGEESIYLCSFNRRLTSMLLII